MSFGHFDVMDKNTDYCENSQNWNIAIYLVKLIILISLNILYCIFSKVWENKVLLEFLFSLLKVDYLVLLCFNLKKTKHGQKCIFH